MSNVYLEKIAKEHEKKYDILAGSRGAAKAGLAIGVPVGAAAHSASLYRAHKFFGASTKEALKAVGKNLPASVMAGAMMGTAGALGLASSIGLPIDAVRGAMHLTHKAHTGMHKKASVLLEKIAKNYASMTPEEFQAAKMRRLNRVASVNAAAQSKAKKATEGLSAMNDLAARNLHNPVLRSQRIHAQNVADKATAKAQKVFNAGSGHLAAMGKAESKFTSGRLLRTIAKAV